MGCLCLAVQLVRCQSDREIINRPQTDGPNKQTNNQPTSPLCIHPSIHPASQPAEALMWQNDCTPSCPAASQHAVPATAVSPDAPAASPEHREAQSEPTLGEEGAAGPSAAADGALAGLKMWNQVSKQCEAECPADQFPMTNGTVYLYCQVPGIIHAVNWCLEIIVCCVTGA